MELNSDQWKWQDGWTERQTDNPKNTIFVFLDITRKSVIFFKLINDNLQKVTKT